MFLSVLCVCIYLNRSSLSSSKYKTANFYDLQRNNSASADSSYVPNINYPPTFIPSPLPPPHYHPFLTQYNDLTEKTNTNRTLLNQKQDEFLYRNSNSNTRNNNSHSIELSELPNEFFAEVLDFSEEKANETLSSNNHFNPINLNYNNFRENNENYSPNGGSIILESRNIEIDRSTTELPSTVTTFRPKATTTTIASTVETSTIIKPSGFALPKDYTRKYLDTYTTPNPNTDNSLIKKYLGPLYFEAIEPTTYSPAFKKILKLFHQNTDTATLSTTTANVIAVKQQSQLHHQPPQSRQQQQKHFRENVTNHDTKSAAKSAAASSVISIDFQYSTPRNLIFKEILTQTFGPKSTTKPTVSPYLSLEAQKSHSHDTSVSPSVAAAVANVNKRNEHKPSNVQYSNYYTKDRNSVVSDVFSSVLSDKKSSSESKKGLDIILEITKIEPTKFTKNNNKSNVQSVKTVNKSQSVSETDQRIPTKSPQTRYVSNERTNFATEKPFYYIRFKNSSFVPLSTEEPADRLNSHYFEYHTTSTTAPITRSYPPRRVEEIKTTSTAPQTTTSTTTSSTTTTTTELPPVVTSQISPVFYDENITSSLHTEIREILTTTTETVLPTPTANTNTGNPPRNLTPQRASRINNSIKTSISSGLSSPGTNKCNEISSNAKCNEILRPLRYYDIFSIFLSFSK